MSQLGPATMKLKADIIRIFKRTCNVISSGELRGTKYERNLSKWKRI